MISLNKMLYLPIALPLTDLTLVMGVDLPFAGKNAKNEIIAMMIIIWQSRNILVEKSITKKTVCCQEAGEDSC